MAWRRVYVATSTSETASPASSFRNAHRAVGSGGIGGQSMRHFWVRRWVLALTAVSVAACGSGRITSITPNSGPASGGTKVTITGAGLAQATEVIFVTEGNAPGSQLQALATAVQALDATSVMCTTPADPNTNVQPGGDGAAVTVVANGGTAERDDAFTYFSHPPPTLSGVTPTSGPTTGGTAVTIAGTNFQTSGVTTVQFGSVEGSGVTVASSTSLSATTPNGNAGAVDVTVTNPDGQSGVLSGGFTYNGFLPAPTLSSVAPASGPTLGGTGVTLNGTNFQAGATVQFGSVQALAVANPANSHGETLTATTPPGVAGLVAVTVTNPDGQSAVLSDGYTYYLSGSAVPTISGLLPVTGPTTGGTSVTIAGTNFQTSGVTTVQFGSALASAVLVQNATTVSATTPGGNAGAVDVKVTDPDGQSAVLPSGFTYTATSPAPTLLSVAPISGPTSGATTVVVSGNNIQAGAIFQFATAQALGGFELVDGTDRHFQVLTPAGPLGAVDVKVTNPDGQSAVLAGGYAYISTSLLTPTLATVTPAVGPNDGGTVVVLSGTNFQNGASVNFGGASAFGPSVTVNSPTSITVSTPPAPTLGAVDVAVSDPDGQGAVLVGGFIYTTNPPPSLSNVLPMSGPTAGGTLVTLSGASFQTGATVQFGSAPATGVTVHSAGSLSATTPAGAAGPVDVKITNPDEQSAVLASGFNYFDVSAITAGGYHTCAIVNGSAQCWGWNAEGQLGNGSTTDSFVPVQVQGLTSGVTAIAAGWFHTCALVSGGVQCWGDNDFGELGNNSTTKSTVPVQVSGLTSGVTAIAAGFTHTCAVANGAAWCWGDNAAGDLGNNSTTQSTVPVQVFGLTSGVTLIAAGEDHSCALVSGAAMCWGENAHGELGNNTTTDSKIPVQVQGLSSGVQAIASGAGADHTCAIPVNNSIQCWGNNSSGQLGNNTTANSDVPVQATGLTSLGQNVAGGFGHTCAQVGNGLFCWGDNDSGDLGIGTTTESNVPAAVGLPGIVQGIAEGGYHSCAVVNGAAWCWGDNEFGDLGNNSQTESNVPVEVYGL